jgi:hypothetical protein
MLKGSYVKELSLFYEMGALRELLHHFHSHGAITAQIKVLKMRRCSIGKGSDTESLTCMLPHFDSLHTLELDSDGHTIESAFGETPLPRGSLPNLKTLSCAASLVTYFSLQESLTCLTAVMGLHDVTIPNLRISQYPAFWSRIEQLTLRNECKNVGIDSCYQLREIGLNMKKWTVMILDDHTGTRAMQVRWRFPWDAHRNN